MDGRGGCCIARYAGGAYDMSQVDRIMLRFRPIAPKPATGLSSSGASSPEMSDVSPGSGRGKRRSSNTNSNGNGSKRCNTNNNNNNNGSGSRRRKSEKVDAAVTLALLPETPDRKNFPIRERERERNSPENYVPLKQAKNVPTWLSFGGNNEEEKRDQMEIYGGLLDQTAVVAQAMRIAVGSCVIVECVTDTWVEVDGLGRTDEERRANLGRDTCPGFISDGYGSVTWTNEAYRKMVGQGRVQVQDGGGGEDQMVAVRLVVKEKADEVAVTSACHAAFTCRVRVQYSQRSCGWESGTNRERSSTTVPCDVWRMDAGGFAWRLDVKAALCLGR